MMQVAEEPLFELEFLWRVEASHASSQVETEVLSPGQYSDLGHSLSQLSHGQSHSPGLTCSHHLVLTSWT